MTPFDDFAYLINHVLLGEEPTIEDFILLIGTVVAFIAFILWCCFPIHPKENNGHQQFSCKSAVQHTFNSSASAQQQQQQQRNNNYSKTSISNSSISSTNTNSVANNFNSQNYCSKRSEYTYHCCSSGNSGT